MVNNPSTVWETWVQSLSWEDPLEKGKATHSSIWPGEFHGLYRPQGCKVLDKTERLFLYERSLKLCTCYEKVSWMMYFLNRSLGDRFCPRAPGSSESFSWECLGDVVAVCLWLQNGRSRLPGTTCILHGDQLILGRWEALLGVHYD